LGDFFINFDLKNAYHSFSINVLHQRFLGFSWLGKFYKFRSLPFGLSVSPYVFTKCLKAQLKFWRGAKNVKVFFFLDDGYAGHQDFNIASNMAGVIKQDLFDLGFLVHLEPPKSFWIPRHVGIVLGYVADLSSGIFTVPEKRVDKARLITNFIFQKKCCVSSRLVARLAGQIQSMSLALGPICRLWTRNIYVFIESKFIWDCPSLLSESAIEEVKFWKNQFDNLKGSPIWHLKSKVDLFSFSDASDNSWGGYVIHFNEFILARGGWPIQFQGKATSSTWRELKAILLVFQSCIQFLRGKHILHRSDNQSTVRIIKHGSSKPDLQILAIQIFNLAVENGIIFLAEWIPRDENEQADYLSKIQDSEDYNLSELVFQRIDLAWGPFTVDRFASHLTNQIQKFNSRWWNPGSSGINAFSQNWQNEYNWCFPPPRLIARVISHMREQKACGVLVIPFWNSAPWWPILCHSPFVWHNFVINWSDLRVRFGLFFNKTCKNSIFSVNPCKFRILVLRICFCSKCKPYPLFQKRDMQSNCYMPFIDDI
jgi:hypothetical protein